MPGQNTTPPTNPMFAITNPTPPKTSEEIQSAFAPDPEDVIDDETAPETEKPVAVSPSPKKIKTEDQATRQATSQLLAGLPSVAAPKRRQREKRYEEENFVIPFRIDVRIEKETREFLKRGTRKYGTQTAFTSALMLQLLLDAGFPIDPNILSNTEE